MENSTDLSKFRSRESATFQTIPDVCFALDVFKTDFPQTITGKTKASSLKPLINTPCHLSSFCRHYPFITMTGPALPFSMNPKALRLPILGVGVGNDQLPVARVFSIDGPVTCHQCGSCSQPGQKCHTRVWAEWWWGPLFNTHLLCPAQLTSEVSLLHSQTPAAQAPHFAHYSSQGAPVVLLRGAQLLLPGRLTFRKGRSQSFFPRRAWLLRPENGY